MITACKTRTPGLWKQTTANEVSAAAPVCPSPGNNYPSVFIWDREIGLSCSFFFSGNVLQEHDTENCQDFTRPVRLAILDEWTLEKRRLKRTRVAFHWPSALWSSTSNSGRTWRIFANVLQEHGMENYRDSIQFDPSHLDKRTLEKRRLKRTRVGFRRPSVRERFLDLWRRIPGEHGGFSQMFYKSMVRKIAKSPGAGLKVGKEKNRWDITAFVDAHVGEYLPSLSSTYRLQLWNVSGSPVLLISDTVAIWLPAWLLFIAINLKPICNQDRIDWLVGLILPRRRCNKWTGRRFDESIGLN